MSDEITRDKQLAEALARGDAAALEQFERDHLSKVELFLGRYRLPHDVLDEVKQRTRERLFVARDGAPPKIAQYAGHKPLDAWLRVVVMSVYQNLRRASRDHANVDEMPLAELAALSPELQLVRHRMNQVFKTCLKDGFDALSADHRQLLRLKFGQQLSLDAMAVVRGVHRATIARQTNQAKAALWKALTDRLRTQLGLAVPEVEALAAELQSRLELSLSGLFK